MRTADWRPWQLRTRERRLLTRPLAQLPDGRLLVAPHLCLATLTVYSNYIAQGQLPWSRPEPPGPVSAALDRLRDDRNRQLERDVERALRDNGYKLEIRVRETDPDRIGVPTLSGEIDVVAGRPGSPILWLLEVKDPADVYAVPEIRRHLDTFYTDRRGKRAYARQLKRKYDDLAPHADDVAAALGLPHRPDGYDIRAAFVTRKPVAAAFVPAPFPFTTLTGLAQFLDVNDAQAS